MRSNSIVKNLINVRLERLTTFDFENLNEVLDKLKVLRSELDSHAYAIKSMELLKLSVAENKKSEIYFLTRELLTTLLNFGMSSSHIKLTCIEHFFGRNVSVSSVDHIDGFYLRVFPHHHETTVCLKIRSVAGIIDDSNIESFGINITDTIPDSFQKLAVKKKFSILEDGQSFVVVEGFSSYDRYSAVEKARARVHRLHDFFGIYNHKETFTLEDKALVDQCCTNRITLVGSSPNHMHFISDSRPEQASIKLDRLLKESRLFKGKDRHKFFRAVEFHGLSVQNTAIENQLLNIWISLETLSPKDIKLSISDNVVKGALPFLGLNYFNKILNQLLFDIKKWNRSALEEAFVSVSAPSKFSPISKLLFLLSNLGHENALAKLFDQMGEFELLRYRTYQMHLLFSDSVKLQKYLDRHQTVLEWQLRRIYRTRNGIVHSGVTPAFTNRLIENAHTYFDQVFEMCCDFSCGAGGLRTLDECYNFARWKYDEYRSNLSHVENVSENVDAVLWQRKPAPRRDDVLKRLT